MKKIISLLFIFMQPLSYSSADVSATPESSDLKRLDVLVKKSETVTPLNLQGMDLRARNFDSSGVSRLRGSNFRNCNFSGSPHQKKIIRHIDFSNCDLTGANFSDTELVSCQFLDAQLTSANFTGATIRHTRFAGSKLQNAIFDNTDQESVGFDRSDLRCSSWKDGKIYRVSFARADERGMKKEGLAETDCSHENVIKTGFFETYHCPCGS